jgi:hypothetical protein
VIVKERSLLTPGLVAHRRIEFLRGPLEFTSLTIVTSVCRLNSRASKPQHMRGALDE